MSIYRVAGAIAGIALAVVPASAQPLPPEPPPPVDAVPVPEPAPEPAPAPAPTPVAPSLTDDELAKLAEQQAAAETIEIDDTAPAESASSVHLDSRELRYRSRTQVSDLLRQVPGLMVSQHAGGGKSDQYFIRGFDADHGTDIAIYADGVPVNNPSHGHGQGYADTHFLIPETVDVIDVHKGPYSAQYGDFYTAGAMELKTIDEVPGPTIWVSGGVPFDGPRALDSLNRRLVGMASPGLRDNADDKALIAAEVGDTEGPFENPQHFRQGNALVKWAGDVGKGRLAIESMWYAAAWNASGQIPEQAIDSGLVDRFGSLDPSEGGSTSRTSAQIKYTLRDDNGGIWRAMTYVVAYRLQLFSDFTMFARDPVHGDEIEQGDTRTTYGLDAAYDKRMNIIDMDSIVTAGVQARADDVETGLWHAQDRARLADCFGVAGACNHSLDHLRTIGVYAQANIHVFPHVHVLPGVRYDLFSWDVEALDGSAGGNASAAIASPKLSVEIEATPKLNVFANAGSGFHSNDARSNVTSGGAGALARAVGAEAGVRTTYLPHVRLGADLWYLHLASELVWNGDEGGTDAQGPTERYGVDLEASWNPRPWLIVDGNISLAHSQFVANAGNGGAIALAPKVMGQGGVTLVRGTSFVALRGRGIGDRPGNDANTLTAEGYFIFDLIAGTQLGKLGLNLTVNNLLDTKWREAQFADTVAITPTSKAVEQMCFTPGIPLTVTGTLSYQF